MKHFLYRMVERAAGSSVTNSPGPPRGFHWPVMNEKSGAAPEARGRPALSTEFHASFFAESPAVVTRSEVRGQGWPEIVDAREPEHPQAIDAHQAHSLLPTATEQPATPSRLVVAQARRTQSQPFPKDREERPRENVENAAEMNQASTAVTSRLQSIQNHPPTLEHECFESTGSDLSPVTQASGPARKPSNKQIGADAGEHVQFVQPAVPVLPNVTTAPMPELQIESPPRQQRPASIYESTTGKEATEPAIEVKIGRVEIQFDPPPAPAVLVPPTRSTSGFAEYAALRRYAVRPWPNTR